eukprot:COSAG01_NODE_19847_length_985_cov_16.770880_1_plen_106_part_00
MHPLPAMQQKVLLLLWLLLLRMLLLSVGEAGHHVPPCMSRPGSGQLVRMVTERVAFRQALLSSEAARVLLAHRTAARCSLRCGAAARAMRRARGAAGGGAAATPA